MYFFSYHISLDLIKNNKKNSIIVSYYQIACIGEINLREMNGNIPRGIKRSQKWHESDREKLFRDFPGCTIWDGLATYKPGNYVLTPCFDKYKEQIYNFKVFTVSIEYSLSIV